MTLLAFGVFFLVCGIVAGVAFNLFFAIFTNRFVVFGLFLAGIYFYLDLVA